MAAVNYSVNYDDKRFADVEAQKATALNELEQTYADMISQSDEYYQAQVDASQEWADRQSQLQQERSDYAIEQIEYQKELAKKDYTKEQSGAYVDWQKQSNPYGASAEAMAAQGMANTGYSESSRVSMYNTYQNRVAAARESYNQAIVNYNMAIKDARLQNNAALAEIAYQALQQQLELSLEGFQYKNSLVISLSDKKLEVENSYYKRYQDVLAQINAENALAEEIRQYNENLAMEQAKLAEEQRQFDAELAEEQRQFDTKQAGKYYGSSKRDDEENAGGDAAAGISGAIAGALFDPDGDIAGMLVSRYGSISAYGLQELIRQGLVERYVSGGKVMYRKTRETTQKGSAPALVSVKRMD